jgi:CubicO group peptidase (beta-lactamase class C family)
LISAAPAFPQDKASPQLLTADTQKTTPAGATFMVPAGWSVATEQKSVTLQPPEPDTHIVLVDTEAATPEDAVTNAWQTYKPDMKRPLHAATAIPDRNGWSGGKQFMYETSPNERAVVVAVARKAGNTWTVALLDGSEPTFEKRAAQINIVLQSLRPKAYQRESFAGRKPLPLTPERVQMLKEFVQSSMQKLGVPGVGLALIDGGKVVYEGGLGVKELGKSAPVDANTLFMAASNTKGMTTLLLARLADSKKLAWDQHVTELYPEFKLGDPNITQQVEVKHLICACTGMPRQDLEWIFEYGKDTPASTFTLLSAMQPTSKFGEVFQYSNLMASAAGYIGGHLYEPSRDLGAAYDDSMRKYIFAPLGMNNTTFDMGRAQRGNFASPHGDDIDGKPQVAPMTMNYSVMPFRPAGGVWTSAHDMTRYALLELSRGKLPNGEQFVSEENLLMRRKPQVPIGEDQAYGMGLMTNNQWGVQVVHHGGSLFGYKSDWMIVPDAGIGAVLLTNSDNGQMMLGPLMRRLLEVVYDGKPEAATSIDTAVANYRLLQQKERQRLGVPADSTEVATLATRYTSPALGDLKVTHDGAKTVFDFDEWKSTVASRKNDDGTISFITVDPTRAGFEFVRAERNGKRALIIRDGQHEYVFAEATQGAAPANE